MKSTKQKPGFFELITELIGGLQIMASPFLISLVIGLAIYLLRPGRTGLITAITLISLGLLIGLAWAVKIWKKKGTNNFISEITSTPEHQDSDNKKE